MRRLLTFAAICAVVAAPLAAYAATVTVPVSQVRKLNFNGNAATVVVGSPEIADVTVVDQRTVIVMGKRQGLTNIVILDRNGRALFTDEILVAEGDQQAVSVSRGRATAYYACAPYCAMIGGERPAPNESRAIAGSASGVGGMVGSAATAAPNAANAAAPMLLF